MGKKTPRLLALDLEGTLVSNATSLFARPGLSGFLDFCFEEFVQVVLFTAVRTERARRCLTQLHRCGDISRRASRMPIIDWQWVRKDLRFIREQIPGFDVREMLLVEDLEDYVEPTQRHQWIPIETWAAPYEDTDRELARVQEVLAARLAEGRSS